MIYTFTAFFDANVFYGARLRSLVVELAQTKLFRARWSEHVHHEPSRPLGVEPRANTPFDGLFSAGLLGDGLRGIDQENLTLPDPVDRHVLAAAIIGRASCLVTFNLAHFPSDYLGSFNLHAVHPDDFLLNTRAWTRPHSPPQSSATSGII